MNIAAVKFHIIFLLVESAFFEIKKTFIASYEKIVNSIMQLKSNYAL